MKHPLALHLKAALICALVAIVLALPLLWVPLLPTWQGWRPPVINPRAEAILAVFVALRVAWCVVDIPRRIPIISPCCWGECRHEFVHAMLVTYAIRGAMIRAVRVIEIATHVLRNLHQT